MYHIGRYQDHVQKDQKKKARGARARGIITAYKDVPQQVATAAKRKSVQKAHVPTMKIKM